MLDDTVAGARAAGGGWFHQRIHFDPKYTSTFIPATSGPGSLTWMASAPRNPPTQFHRGLARELFRNTTMKVRNSLKSLRGRHRDNRLVRRKGRVYVINKTQKRFKARQG